jgi:hypothetical protein
VVIGKNWGLFVCWIRKQKERGLVKDLLIALAIIIPLISGTLSVLHVFKKIYLEI